MGLRTLRRLEGPGPGFLAPASCAQWAADPDPAGVAGPQVLPLQWQLPACPSEPGCTLVPGAPPLIHPVTLLLQNLPRLPITARTSPNLMAWHAGALGSAPFHLSDHPAQIPQ